MRCERSGQRGLGLHERAVPDIDFGFERGCETRLACGDVDRAGSRVLAEQGTLRTTKHLDLIDIDSGHWPMLTRPAELAAVLAGR